MSEITVRRDHSLPLAAARAAAEKVAARLKKDFDLDYAWKRHVLHFARAGVDGELHVTDHDVRLEARLGFLLSFLQPRIEREIDAQFERHFGAAAAQPPAKKASRAAAKKRS
ncbi:MAG: polyhydroxyalkanoic acid system family protein [Burkholderiales bacterium]